MKPSFYSKYSLAIILTAVFMLPISFAGARRAMLSNKNDVKQWLPDTYGETQVYREFREQFSGEEFVLVSWDGCVLGDQRIELMARKLVPPEAHSDHEACFSKVLTGPGVIETLTQPPINLTREQAIERLRGSLIGPDLKQTCLVLTLSEAAKDNLRHCIQRIDEAAAECNIPLDELHMGGPPSDNVAIDIAGEQSLVRLASLAGIIGLLISWWCLRNFKLVLMVLAAGLYSAAVALAVVYYSGRDMNAIVLTMPSLVYVAAISGAIHLANYYRDTVREKGVEGAPGRAIAQAWLPLSLATGTTAVGLLSLCYSELVPIQMFGFYSAVGVVVSVLFLFFFLPAAFQLWPLRESEVGDGSDSMGIIDPAFFKGWHRIGEGIVTHHAWVTVGGIAVLAVCGYGMTRIETSVQLMRLFSPQAKVVTDYKWLEANLGELVPMEVVLNVDPEKSKMTFLERMELVQAVQKEVESIEEVGSALSAVTFAPPLGRDEPEKPATPTRRRGGISGIGRVLQNLTVKPKSREYVEREVRNTKLEESRDRILEGDYLKEVDGKELWRISARVSALKDVDYAKFVNELESRVEPLLAKYKDKGVTSTYTGLVPLVYKAQNSLLDGLVIGFVMDLVLIFVAITIAQRSVAAGLILILPSVFPPVVVFGLMGWLKIVVDIGTVMTPSVALGVSVDDIVHFMLKYRRGVAAGLSRREAVMMAYHHCGRAMYQSWGVIGLGLSVFALSPFTPTQRFGYLMITLLTASLLGNLILLPALLAGPLGRMFARGARPKAPSQDVTESGRSEPPPPKRTQPHEEPVAIEATRRSIRT